MPALRCAALASLISLAGLSLSLHAQLALPLAPDSVRFAVIGDMGTGEPPQYEVAGQLITDRQRFPFEFVIALGDDLYGGSEPGDFEKKFERPCKLLLDAGVKFYAVLGNHDSPNKRFYKPFKGYRSSLPDTSMFMSALSRKMASPILLKGPPARCGRGI
jgi:hypothetical protein